MSSDLRQRDSKPSNADLDAAKRLRDAWNALAQKRGLTQGKMGERLGVSQGAVSHYLSGRNALNFRALMHFSNALGIDPLTIRDDLPEQALTTSANPHAIISAASVATGATHDAYIRVEQFDAEADMGDGRLNDDYPEVMHAVEFDNAYIRSVIGYVPAPGRLKLFRGAGDSMKPLIEPGEPVAVDTGCTWFDGDGVYLINSGNGHQFKMLQDRRDGIYVVSANPLYPAFKLEEGTLVGGKAYIQIKLGRLA